MPPKPIDDLIAEMTLDEKAALLAGRDLWSTAPLERLGLPSVRVTDGPNGARGPLFPGEGFLTSACVPCGAALGATWDSGLLTDVGAMLGEEARSKGARVLLAPTVNIHRSPLAGRNFECYSEDPLLSGAAAAAFVRGVQSVGVATTVKHFAGNDAEFERTTVNSVIDERALREIYLVPFEHAVRDGGSLGVMTGYNRLNGRYCGEHVRLLDQILRTEWGFEGFVVSDWYAVGSTLGCLAAGLDLEMPGPGRSYGPALAGAVRDGTASEADVDSRVRTLLRALDRVGALDDPPEQAAVADDRPEHRRVARRAAVGATVLLANDGILPLAVDRLTSVAVIGPNADRPRLMGGGSANFRPHYRVSPVDALRARLAGRVEVIAARGCDTDPVMPLLTPPELVSGGGALTVEFGDGSVEVAADSRILLFNRGEFTFRAHGRLTPGEDGTHRLSLVQAGRARVLIDEEVVLDGVTDPPPPGAELFGLGSRPVTADLQLVAGTSYDVVIEYSSEGSVLAHGVIVGCRRPAPADLMDRAVDAAAGADVAIVVVGTHDEWESEGHDRPHMDLPGEQDELIRRVVGANPNTVVAVNTGAPVTMPWAGSTRAVLQLWFGGQEMADALVDVLLGDEDPGGRLPTTFPMRLEHNPSYGNFPGDNGEVRYGEGILVGYRWYEARDLPVRYPFGHGLSYTSWEIGPPETSSATFAPGGTLHLRVPVTNTGDRAGSQVVQCYVAPPPSHLFRPLQELKAFAKVHLGPGESTTVDLELDDRSFAYWDPGDPEGAELAERAKQAAPFPRPRLRWRSAPGWRIDPGPYRLRVGRSSVDIAHTVEVAVGEQ